MEVVRHFVIADDGLVRLVEEFQELHNYPAIINQLRKNYPALFDFLSKSVGRKDSEVLSITLENRPPGSITH